MDVEEKQETPNQKNMDFKTLLMSGLLFGAVMFFITTFGREADWFDVTFWIIAGILWIFFTWVISNWKKIK